MNKEILNVLMVSSSIRQHESVSRRFAGELLASLQEEHGSLKIQERDVSIDMTFIDEHWVNANFTAEEERNEKHKATLAFSDTLVKELQQADAIVISVPIYNFSIPASLKAWIDLIARVGVTFNYSSDGPVGKLKNKKAYLIIASGGTEVGSDIDFASGYLRHILGFIGIKDVSIISASAFDQDDNAKIQNISAQIQTVTKKVA